jgi:hypothetical protein
MATYINIMQEKYITDLYDREFGVKIKYCLKKLKKTVEKVMK